jgi:hypothetical protein
MKKVLFTSILVYVSIFNIFSDDITNILNKIPDSNWGKAAIVKTVSIISSEDDGFSIQVRSANELLNKEDIKKIGLSDIDKKYSIIICKFKNDTKNSSSIFNTYIDGVSLIDMDGSAYSPINIDTIDKKEKGGIKINRKYVFADSSDIYSKPKLLQGSVVYMFMFFKDISSYKQLNIEDYINEKYIAFVDMQASIKTEINVYDSIDGNLIISQRNQFKYDIISEENDWQQITINGWMKKRIGSVSVNTNDCLVTISNTKFERYSEDYSRSSKPYGNHVRAYFAFKNESNKKLLGVIFDVKMYDSFNDLLYTATDLKYQFILGPGEQNNDNQYWYWEEGYNSPYSKIWDSVENNTMKAKIVIKSAVFEDGVKINY